jgi:peptidoglycan-N-acetylglucosamine deacetylase
MSYSASPLSISASLPVFLDPTQRRWTVFVAIGSSILFVLAIVFSGSALSDSPWIPPFAPSDFLRWAAVLVAQIWTLVLPLIFVLAVVLGTLRTVLLIAFSFTRRRSGYCVPAQPMSVGVVVPAFNESKVVLKTVHSLLRSSHPNLTILVVDDGSTDDTYERCKTAFSAFYNVAVITKPNGGKSDALNVGFDILQTDIIVALDADTVFPPDTISHLVHKLADPKVAAVAGNAKVGNRVNLFTRLQALEYITSQNLDRRAFDTLKAISVVPGAVGAWRRQAVLDAGGYTTDTLAEDADLTIRLLRQGYDIRFAPEAVALTEAPETLVDFLQQRHRWTFGTMQMFRKHIDVLKLNDSKPVALIAMPNVLLFQFILPLFAPIVDLGALAAILVVVFGNWLVPASQSYDTVTLILLTFLVFTIFDHIAAAVAFSHERNEDWRLLLLILPQRILYRQLNNFVVVRALLAAIKGRAVGWGTLARSASVLSPAGREH